MDHQVEQSAMKPIPKLHWFQPRTKIVWPNAIFVIGIHFGALYYVFQFPYMDHKFLLLWTFLANYLTMFGTTAGVHRLWSHRTYKAKVPLRIFLALCYFSSGQEFGIGNWVRIHRTHHKYSDTEADPHNSTRGFLFSHIGWVMLKKTHEARERAKGIDMSDIEADQVVQFFDRNIVILKILLNLVVPVFVPVYLFGQDLKWTFVSQIFLRYTLEVNMVGCINSVTHMYGYRPYDKSIAPSQNRLASFLTIGEGWHNYHHVFPWDYKAAELNSYIFNSAAFWIEMFAKIGWAYDLKQATPNHILSVVEKKGDGSHHSIHDLSKDNRKCKQM